eukprot:TRINITY_DN677_c1_g1_i1.p1 TRINITY_DN677_c1_g1~~TRINITY_DN677_c1_g1_i1.p1  ORF type:complete len:576 (-),score=11.39 TRINITY_DN677_c1_g1_i1:1393-3036(-)
MWYLLFIALTATSGMNCLQSFIDVDDHCQDLNLGGISKSWNDEYQFLVSLWQTRSNSLIENITTHLCNGILLQKGVVLTAASCIWATQCDGLVHRNISFSQTQLNQEIWVAFNPNCRPGYGDCAMLHVKDYYVPQEYDGYSQNGYDIAILLTEEDPLQEQYEGPFANIQDSLTVDIYQDLIVAGLRFSNNLGTTNVTMYSKTEKILSDIECSAHLKNFSSTSQFCSIDNFLSSCGSASGNPVIALPYGSSDYPVIVGLLSWVQNSSTQGQIIRVYTSVVDMLDWIQETLSDIQVALPVPSQYRAFKIFEDNSGYKCRTVSSFNAKGNAVDGIQRQAPNENDCCRQCNEHPECNTFVFCPRAGFCRNGNNPIAQYQCDLKYQDQVAQNNEPEFYYKGIGTDFMSGFIPGKSKSGSPPTPTATTNNSPAYRTTSPTVNNNNNPVSSSSSNTGECRILSSFNAKGDIIDNWDRNANSIEECCQKCSQRPRCNVFVYCQKPQGCYNNGNVLPYKLCDLKFQQKVAQNQEPEYWVQGAGTTDFDSGYILGKY